MKFVTEIFWHFKHIVFHLYCGTLLNCSWNHCFRKIWIRFERFDLWCSFRVISVTCSTDHSKIISDTPPPSTTTAENIFFVGDDWAGATQHAMWNWENTKDSATCELTNHVFMRWAPLQQKKQRPKRRHEGQLNRNSDPPSLVVQPPISWRNGS